MVKFLYMTLCVLFLMLYGNDNHDFLSLSYMQFIQQHPGGDKNATDDVKELHITIADFLTSAGDFYAKLGNEKKAIEKYEEALTHYVTGTLYKNYGTCFFNAGEYQKSIVAYKIATVLGSPMDSEMYFRMARAYSMSNQAIRAFEYLDLAIINGYRNSDEIKGHPDLVFLRSHKDWDSWYEKRKGLLVSYKTHYGKGLAMELLFSKNSNDSSGNKNHGTIIGAQWSSEGGMSFDGHNDYVEIKNAPVLNPTDQITVSAWYKTASFRGIGNDVIVEKPYTAHQLPLFQYHIGACGEYYSHSQRAFLFDISINGQGIQVQTPPYFYDIGKWYFLAGTYDGFFVRLYVNGKVIDSKKITGEIDAYDTPVRIGGFVNLNARTPGIIDDVRIHDGALSPDEIQQIFNKGRSIK